MIKIRAAIVGLLLICANVGASAQQSEPLARSLGSAPIHYRQEPTVSAGSYSGAGLAIVILMALGVLAVRYGQKRGIRVPLKGLRNERLKLVEVLHLSGRSRVYLVEADGERLVIGEQQSSITIHPLPRP
jgi:hypothetical protein